MNNWPNRRSQYPMLSWRAWRNREARKWFISWEPKSNCSNLKLSGIQVESTKAQPVKTTAKILLSSVQIEEVMYVKFLYVEMGMGGFRCYGSKASRNTERGGFHHNDLLWAKDCPSLWGSAMCPSFMPHLGGSSCSPPYLPSCSQSLDCILHSWHLWEEEKLILKGHSGAMQRPHVYYGRRSLLSKVLAVTERGKYILAVHLHFISNLQKHHWVPSLQTPPRVKSTYCMI